MFRYLQKFLMHGAVVTSLALYLPYDAAVREVLLKRGIATFLNTRG